MNSTSDINIKVTTAYLSEHSIPEKNRYAFSYTINISNHGKQTAKLLSRHWIITDTDNRVQEVRGEGVIGEQPVIAPGDHYEYTSGAVIETPAGTMEGSYQMISEAGKKFDAPIALFSLIHPSALH